MKEGDFFKRNEDLLRDVIRERNYEISEQEIKELNEMSVLIYGECLQSCEVTGTSRR